MTEIVIESDNKLEKVTNIADVAEVAKGRLMIATFEREKDIISGSIFGASGVWKMWHEQAGNVEQFVAQNPLSIPPTNFTRFRYKRNGNWVKRDRDGRIKRLKKPDTNQ